MNEPLLIFGMMLVTFGVRYPVLAVVGRIRLPDSVIRALRYVPVVVLTAIIIPAMLFQDGEVTVALDNAYLVAGIFSAAVAWRTRNLLWTIGLGMAFFLLWRGVLG